MFVLHMGQVRWLSNQGSMHALWYSCLNKAEVDDRLTITQNGGDNAYQTIMENLSYSKKWYNYLKRQNFPREKLLEKFITILLLLVKFAKLIFITEKKKNYFFIFFLIGNIGHWSIIFRPWDHTNLVLNSIEKVKPGSLFSLMYKFPKSNRTKFWSHNFHLQTSGIWPKGGHPMKTNFQIFQIQKWISQTVRAQKVDEKMGSFV